jgi:Flp pilus assembly protein TadG
MLCKALLQRRAAVALIVALSSPVLIGVTGLAVDAGFWYQQQVSLQSAADAAALAAAMTDTRVAQTASGTGTTIASTASNNSTSAANTLAYAKSAADVASNQQFGFAAGKAGSSLTVTAGTSNGATTYTAVATAARTGFFSGMLGIMAGSQTTAAKTLIVTINTAATCGAGSATPCCLEGTTIYATGGAKITAPNCGLGVSSTGCNASSGSGNSIDAEPSATISAQTITTQGCAYANRNGGASISAAGGTSSNGYNINQNAAAVADPLASLGNPPSWPTMPTPPSAPSGLSYSNVGSYLGYNTNSGTWGDCTYNGNYSGFCELYQGAYSGLNSVGVVELTMNLNTSTGTSYISGGLGGYANLALVMNANSYFINGGLNFGAGTLINMSAANNVINGGVTFSGGSANVLLAKGTDYFTGATNPSGTVTGWGLNVNEPVLYTGGGNLYVNGGAYFASSNATITLGQGNYMFSSYSGSTNGALDDTNANLTFTGGTYYFNGGLNIGGSATVTFGPGIYYIENGNLNFASGSKVTANGATFVLEGTAGFQMNGGTVALNLTAPTSNCVAAANYPNTSYTTAAPYDGTNGEGICGVLIYQARNDTAADSITEGANSTINGIIYAPGGNLTISGGASISAANNADGTVGTLAVYTSALSMTGSGQLNLSLGSNSGLPATGSTTYAPYLIN